MFKNNVILRNKYIKNFLKKILRRKRAKKSQWSFTLDLNPWDGQINSPETEEFSGIKIKIQKTKAMGPTTIIGGITTGGSDDIFSEEPEAAINHLKQSMEQLSRGVFLLLYIPHPFWAQLFRTGFKWLPSWNEIYEIFRNSPDWTIIEYSTSFDSSGRYYFIAQKICNEHILLPVSNLSQQVFRVFYHSEGNNTNNGHSGHALSEHLCNSLARTGAVVYCYDMQDLNAVDLACPTDILIGHVGPWVRKAYDKGFRRIILFFPMNRWYETRHLAKIESNSSIGEQVKMSQMVIAQSGNIWRLSEAYPLLGKLRWIDLGIERQKFPKIKNQFNPIGHRRFCFIHLYDDAQKGADIAREIIDARPDYQFIWIGGQYVSHKNVKYIEPLSNTSDYFRRQIKSCDFILVPSHEDAQPGTFVEAASLGLIPVCSLTSGYSISYPKIIYPNAVDQWVKALDQLQTIPESVLIKIQTAFEYYLSSIHDWNTIENQITHYLMEFISSERKT